MSVSTGLLKENSYRLVPVHILTGFLGSGKTTLLNRLLGQTGLENTAVIVNEFGSVGIDHLLVEARTEDIMMLEGGCLCCSVRTDLVETLEGLYKKRASGEIPAFEQVVVETTGLADPAPVLRTLMNDEFCTAHYRFDAVVTTVDAVHADRQLSEYDESVKQAALAHHLVVTKTDLADADSSEQLRRRLRHINPGARLHDLQQDRIEARALFDSGAYHHARRNLDVTQWLQSAHYSAARQRAPFHHAPSGELPRDAYIKTFCLEYMEPLSWQVLERWIAQLTRIRGKDLLRVKGVAYTVETDLPVVVQGVQHIFQPPVTLANWPWQPPHSKIVFITRNIPREVVESNLQALLRADSPQAMCEAAMLLL